MEQPNVNVNADVDVNELINQVGSVVSNFHDQNIDRSDATQAIVKFLLETYPTKNCMVVHSQYFQNFEGAVKIHFELPQTFGTIGYDIFVFDKGNFELLGDGGFINWCFGGNFDRNGKSVEFKIR